MENQKNPVGADPEEYQNIKDFLSDTLTHSDDGSSLSLRLQVLLSTSPLLRETPVPAPQPDQKAESRRDVLAAAAKIVTQGL